MLTTFFTISLVLGVNAQVEFIVTPPIVEPGFTPFFTLRCSTLEQEEGNVQSISISRRTTTARNASIVPKKLIAELRGTSPYIPIVSPDFQNVTAQGQIVAPEAEGVGPAQPVGLVQLAELGTFLEVVWQQPTIDDLGVYVCDVTILQPVVPATGLSLFAEVRVSTSSPVVDYLLGNVQTLQRTVDTFNISLQEISAQVDSINAARAQERSQLVQQNTTSESPKIVDTTTKEQVDKGIQTPAQATVTRRQDYGDTTEKTRTPASEAELRRLTTAIETLELKFESFNETLTRLDQLVSTLQQEADERDADNDTYAGLATADVISNFFQLGNSSYFLFQTNVNTNTYRAQIVCEGNKLYLTEINDEEEFQGISSAIAAFVPEGGVVLIGGQKLSLEGDRTYQRSQKQEQPVNWRPVVETQPTTNQCLALQKTGLTFSTIAVSCVSDAENFLCERDL